MKDPRTLPQRLDPGLGRLHDIRLPTFRWLRWTVCLLCIPLVPIAAAVAWVGDRMLRGRNV